MNRRSPNPLGLGLVVVGSAALALATFLPLHDATGVFSMIKDNTLIQHGGWMLVVLAIGIAFNGYRAEPAKRGWFARAVVLCVFAAVEIIYQANNKDARTLYPVGLDGTLDTSKPTVASLGIALYVAGVGVGLALIGSVMLYRSDDRVPDDSLVAASAKTKKCPDCAETILADARVCKHCGYRFPTAKVKCGKCQHVQSELQDQSVFECQGCGTRLKRQTTPAEGR